MSAASLNKQEKNDLKLALEACRTSFFSVGVFSMFINILMLVPAIYMLQLYDRVITSGSESTLWALTILMVFLFLVMGLLEGVRSRILVRVSNKLETLLNKRLFNATFKSSLDSGGRVATAQPLDDLTGLRQFLTGNGLFAFMDAPWVPIYIAVMFLFHPWYGWIAVGVVIILMTLALITEMVTGKALMEANQEARNARTQVNKNLSNAEVIASMGMLNQLRDRWNSIVHKMLYHQQEASSRMGTLRALSKSIRITSQSLILGIGAYLVLLQEITPGLMIAGSILLGRALAPIDLMIGSWKGFVTAREQYARLGQLLERVPADKEKMELPSPQGRLDVQNIIVAAPGERSPIIKGASFSLAAGEALGIMGPSGAGKSTLARALLGIWPALSGKVRLDGADIYDWDRDHLGPFIGYLPQDIELFDGTIGDNIARFTEMDPEKVVEAARLANVHEMILKMPEGYDTVIGSASGALSGGQRQRIGLARAVYGDPKLILLDEPNSNLDEQGEAALSVALQALKQRGVTTIVISHRKGVLNEMDKIMLLNEGAVSMFGSREEVFKKLQEAQAAVRQAAAPAARPAAIPVVNV